MWRGLSAVPVWPGSPHYEDVCGGCDAALRHHYCSNLLVIYTVVFLSVVVSGFFTVLYSMEWGHTKSVDWLTTFLLSIAQSIVFVQPVKVRTISRYDAKLMMPRESKSVA